MGFDSYDNAFRAALKQSRSMLTDVKLYIKWNKDGKNPGLCDGEWRIGFTPDYPDDSYIYNGEVKNDETND